MMRGSGSAGVFIAVMNDALKKFGRIDEHNRDQVTRWVRRRMQELTNEREQRDAKAAAAGGDE